MCFQHKLFASKTNIRFEYKFVTSVSFEQTLCTQRLKTGVHFKQKLQNK